MNEAVLRVGGMITRSKKRKLELFNDHKIDIVQGKQQSLGTIPNYGIMNKRSKKRKVEFLEEEKKKKIEIVDDADVKLDKLYSIVSDCKRRLELLKDYNCKTYMKGDRLSSLPDCILVEILSRLPIEDAVATSTLSRPWRHLWTQMSRLRFISSDVEFDDELEEENKYVDHVDHILRQITTSNIHSFSVELPCPSFCGDTSKLNSWFERICNGNVVEIKISAESSLRRLSTPLPHCLFQCKSLEYLELSGNLHYQLPKNGAIGFPYLKKLSIVIKNNPEPMLKLFKSIPALQDLDLFLRCVRDEYLEISAPALKTLSIDVRREIVIHTPKLEYLKIQGILVVLLHIVVKNPRKLRTANISGLQRIDVDIKGKIEERAATDIFTYILSNATVLEQLIVTASFHGDSIKRGRLL